MREIFNFEQALKALADGKVVMNSYSQPIRYRIKDGKYELNSLGKWIVQSYFYINADDMKAEWWEIEPEPKWKEAKWWEAANILIAFPNEGYVQSYGSIFKEWITLKREDLDLSVLKFSSLRLRVRDFTEEGE